MNDCETEQEMQEPAAKEADVTVMPAVTKNEVIMDTVQSHWTF